MNLVCPHCGHDGTRETVRTPGGSYGFNYLAEGLISREVSGCDEAGRLRLSAEYRWQPMQGENVRLECRACWHTFPLPEGLPGPVAAGGAPPPSEAPATEPLREELAPRTAIGQQQRENAARLGALEATVAGLAQAVEELRSLKTEVTASMDRIASPLRDSEKVGGHASARRHPPPAEAEPGVLEKIEQLREAIIRQAGDAKERADALETAYREAAQASTWLGEVIARLEVGQQATKQRLDAQADVIRGLHAAAQEQKTRGEEMRAAVQRLEEIVAGLGRVGPLPKDL